MLQKSRHSQFLRKSDSGSATISSLFLRLRSCLLNLNLKTAKHRRTGAWFRGGWGTLCHLLSEQQQLVAGGEQLLVHLCQPADERGLPGAAVHAGVDEVDEEEGEGHDHQQGDPVPVETSGAMCCFVEPAWHLQGWSQNRTSFGINSYFHDCLSYDNEWGDFRLRGPFVLFDS